MEEENETPPNKVDSVKNQESEEGASVNDVVAKRLAEEATKGATQQAQRDGLKQDDPNRAISLGELRKLIAEINGSFERVANALESMGSQVSTNANDISALSTRIAKLEQKAGINYLDSMPPMQNSNESKK